MGFADIRQDGQGRRLAFHGKAAADEARALDDQFRLPLCRQGAVACHPLSPCRPGQSLFCPS